MPSASRAIGKSLILTSPSKRSPRGSLRPPFSRSFSSSRSAPCCVSPSPTPEGFPIYSYPLMYSNSRRHTDCRSLRPRFVPQEDRTFATSPAPVRSRSYLLERGNRSTRVCVTPPRTQDSGQPARSARRYLPSRNPTLTISHTAQPVGSRGRRGPIIASGVAAAF